MVMAVKPGAYSWRQLVGAGALAGIGFTMSLFIAAQAYPLAADFAATKIAIFVASVLAGSAGLLILWPRRETADAAESTEPAGSAALTAGASAP